MRIAFVLPGRTVTPVGGFKVVYEYANLLARRGHEVSVVHPYDCSPPASWRQRLRARLWVARLRRRRDQIAPWFELDPLVRLPLVVYPGAAELPQADALIATAWQTAEWVAAAADGERRGFYLIQHFESWDRPEDVLATWRLPLHKIVIARWLEEMAIEIGEGERTSWVPNGLDFERFGLDVAPQERPPRVGALLSRFKGREDVIAAFEEARRRVPELSAATYGTAPRPEELPDWIEYTRLPSPDELRRLYNSCSIFLQASRTEGWGLPATEAMACGCALVTYENGGSREYAIDGETASVVSEHEPARLAAAIVELAEDRELRLQRSRRGRELVETFTWPRSVAELEGVLGTSPASEEAGRR
jgi:glycosyltransferase involved in cell wall biosynthesis